MTHDLARALALAAPFALLLGGCASLEPTHTGFLPTYAEDPVAPVHQSRMVNLAGPRPANEYRYFILESVEYRPAAGAANLRPAQIDELERSYQQDLRRVFGKHLTETSTPGPDVVVVRAAITDVLAANPWMNGVTMAVALVPLTAGGAASEAEVVDSITGKPIAVMQGVANGGRNFLGGPVGYLSSLGQARRALSRQSEELGQTFFQCQADHP